MSIARTGRAAAIACLLVIGTLSARADDSVNGAALFAANCEASGCHNTSTPLTSNTSKIFNARNARAWIQSNISSNNSGMGRLSALTAQQVADVAAYLGTSSGSPAVTLAPLTFPTTAVGSTSPTTQTINVAASLKSGYAISGLSVATTGDFALAGGTCGTTVAVGTSCTVIVSFTPTAAGTRTGTLSISHATTLTPIVTALSGTGSAASGAPVASVTPASLTFASTAIGTTSAAQSVSVANTGTAALTISAISSSNPSDFTIAGGTCAVGSLAAGASCVVSVAFAPSAGATGARAGSLSITHNAAGSPSSVSLSGTATAAAAPVATLTSSLSFGSINVGSTSTAQTATLSNTGTALLTIGSLSTGSTEFTITGGSCSAGGSVVAGSSCSVLITFTPSTAGARSATLTVTHNAAGSSSSAALSGTGVALNPVIVVSPSTLSFSQTVNTTSAAQSITVSNTGNAPLVLGATTLSGAQASDYALAAGTTCTSGASIAANGSCVLKVSFTPTATGTRTASLALANNAAASPSTVALNGNGTTTPQPAISLGATTIAFGPQTVGSTSAAQSVQVSNSGAAPLTLGAFTLTGTAASDFGRSGSCATGSVLAAGATCSLTIAFTPGAIGARSATLTLASDASNGTAALSLSGTGAAVATPAVTLAPASLSFGNQALGTTSVVRTATLTNSGSGTLNISAITATAGFAVSHNCGTSVAPAAACTLSATFTPSALGAASGSIGIASDAAGSPQSVGLSGTGVAASPVLAWAPATTTLAFADTSVGASAATQTLTLSNQGPGTVALQQLTIAGAQASDFSIAPAGTCTVGASMAQSASCTVVLAFQPGAAGARSAVLQVASSGTNPPDVALSGNGTSPAQAAVSVAPTALSFTATSAAAPDPQVVMLQSTGNAVLHVTAWRIAAGSFAVGPAASGGCATAPFDLMPGQSCALVATWSSDAVGTETGLLEVDTNAAATPMQIALQATRSASASTSLPNAGGGGCSIARADTPTDPIWALLTFLAAGVLWRRRSKPQPDPTNPDPLVHHHTEPTP